MKTLLHYWLGLTAPAFLLLLLSTVAAGAQTPMPKTVPMNDKSGQQVGTATFSGNRVYLRDSRGELIAQIVIDRDGTRTMYDPHGKVLDQIPGEAK